MRPCTRAMAVGIIFRGQMLDTLCDNIEPQGCLFSRRFLPSGRVNTGHMGMDYWN